MDRCAVLVDAGYLLSTAGALNNVGPDRSALCIDYPGLVHALLKEAHKQTGLPVLRVLWYDGARGGVPTEQHRELRLLPDVKLRLGETVRRGDRIVQKGVDSFLQRDLATLARNQAVCDVVLVGGDEDLRRGVDEAQDYGVRVHLWGVESSADDDNQSETLIGEADRRWVIPANFIRQFVTIRKAAQPPGSQARPESPRQRATEAIEACPVNGTPPTGHSVTPADLAKLRFGYADGARPSPPPVRPPAYRTDTAVPRLADITNSAQEWHDNETDKASAPSEPKEIGRVFGTRWGQRADPTQVEELLRRESDPAGIPSYLDGELLKYATWLGVDTWEKADAKIAVRQGFWAGVRAARRASRPT